MLPHTDWGKTVEPFTVHYVEIVICGQAYPGSRVRLALGPDNSQIKCANPEQTVWCGFNWSFGGLFIYA